MSDHGSVQSVLGHHAAAAPTLLSFTPFRATVLKPNLDGTKNMERNKSLARLGNTGGPHILNTICANEMKLCVYNAYVL